jgi:hypothetical protein
MMGQGGATENVVRMMMYGILVERFQNDDGDVI